MPTSKHLTPRTVRRIHELSRAGNSRSEVARTLGIHRNTVRAHLQNQRQYSDPLALELGLQVTPPQRGRVSLAVAATLLPGWPSHDKMRRLVRAGLLAPIRHNGRLTVTVSEVKRLAKKMLGPGLWYSTLTLRHIAGAERTRELRHSLRDVAADLRYWPSGNWHAYLPAIALNAQLHSEGESLDIPAASIRRAVAAVDTTGVGTI